MGAEPGAAARRRSGSRSGITARLRTIAFGTSIRSAPLTRDGVEEAQRADDSLLLSGERAADQPHPVADPKGAGAEQHEAGEQVPERLLCGEAEHDRRDRAADRERAGREAPPSSGATATTTTIVVSRIRNPTVPAVRRIHAAKQRRGEPAPERLGERPCQDRQGHDRRDLHRRPEAGEERRRGDRRATRTAGDQDRAGRRPCRGPAGPPWRSISRAEADLTPRARSATRTRCSARRNRPSPSMGNVFSRSAGRHALHRQPRPGANLYCLD